MSAYNLRPIPKINQQNQRRFKIWPFLAVLVVAIVYAVYCLARPISALTTTITPPVIPGQIKVNVPWPSTGQAAFGAVGYGLLAEHNDDKPLPTASVAKIVAALAILDKKPLKPGETGPGITITDRDVAIYDQYVAEDGSVVPVYTGETITEYQALQAMMLPSANNMADTTAIWAFGSLENYTAFANQFVTKLDMPHTTITSASGFLPTTVSTASDLINLGMAALANPVLSAIVSQSHADFPNYGTMDNVNTLLGSNGIRGIKTGNTDQAGGVYLAAADVPVGGKKVTVISAVMGAPTLGAALRSSLPLIQASVSEFQNVTVVDLGQKVGSITSAWGAHTDITAGKNISVITWNGTALSPKVSQKKLTAPAPAGTDVGSLSLTANGTTYTSPLTTTNAISQPTALWRLTHPI